MGYAPYTYTNQAASTAYNRLTSTDIWVHDGHGDIGAIGFTKGLDTVSNTSLIRVANLQLPYNSQYVVNSLGTNTLANSRLIITMGCKVAKNINNNSTSGDNNIIDAFFERGAHCAIGFTSEVDNTEGTNFIWYFFSYSNYLGTTIGESADYASAVGPSVAKEYMYLVGDKFSDLRG